MADEIRNTEEMDTEEIEQEETAIDDGEQNNEAQDVIDDPIQMLRKLCKGTLKLFSPLRARGHDIEALQYDFVGLSTYELLDALDNTEIINTSPFAITNRQAIAIFAATAGKCTEDVDARDVRDKISSVDAIKAIQLAKLFWNASHRAGNKNISND